MNDQHQQTEQRMRKGQLPATRVLPVGAAALGAVALGTAALGAVAIGRLAIGAFAMRRGRVRTLIVDNLEVRRLHVGELTTDTRPDVDRVPGCERNRFTSTTVTSNKPIAT